MSTRSRLTKNAILYISVGFQQHSLLQVLSIRRGQESSVEMVVYDGTIYAGALYHYSAQKPRQNMSPNNLLHSEVELSERSVGASHPLLPKQLDVIKVKAVLVTKNQPLYPPYNSRHIVELEIVESGLSEILGKEILTLEQYMKRRMLKNSFEDNQRQEEEIHSRKLIKINQEQDFSSENQVETMKKDVSISTHQILPQSNHSENSVRNNPQMVQPFIVQEQQQLQKEQIQKYNQQSNESAQNSKNQSEVINSSIRQNPEAEQPQVQNKQPTNPVEVPPIHEQQKTQKLEDTNKEGKRRDWKAERIAELLLDEDCQITQVKPVKGNKRSIIDLISDNNVESEPVTQKNALNASKVQKAGREDFMMIQELYERMHRFRILCRINHISHFKSQKGNPCTKLILIDQRGDQILCFLFEKATQHLANQKISFHKGMSYIFENGDVEKDQIGSLNITVPWSGIHLTKDVIGSFHPDKMIQVRSIQSIQPNYFQEKPLGTSSKSINNRKGFFKEINVCGILKGLQGEPKLVNNQFRVFGTICDPDHEKSINFTLFLDELVSFPKEGAVISLHNMRVIQHQRTYKLDHTKRSYYLVENSNTHQYFAELRQASEKHTWKQKQYKNLSEVTFVSRTIAQLKDLLLKMLQHDECNSQIDCNIARIVEKKEVNACSVCYHQTKPDKGPRAYCFHCKKLQKWSKRYVLTSEVADSTSAMDVIVAGEAIEGFINIPQSEYGNMSKQERATHLQLSTYQNILIKVRSQRINGGSTHYVAKVGRINHKRGLEHIKEQSIQNRTKYIPHW